RRRRLRAKKRKRREGSGDLPLQYAQGVPAHHGKVRALLCRSLGRRKSPGNGHAIPTHEKTATSRCIRLGRARKSNVTRHAERSEAESKDPVALPRSLFRGIPRLRSE